MTHICGCKIIIIGSDNGLLPGRRKAIIWTNAGILLIGPLGINFSEILIEINKKMHLKMSFISSRSQCVNPYSGGFHNSSYRALAKVSRLRHWLILSRLFLFFLSWWLEIYRLIRNTSFEFNVRPGMRDNIPSQDKRSTIYVNKHEM